MIARILGIFLFTSLTVSAAPAFSADLADVYAFFRNAQASGLHPISGERCGETLKLGAHTIWKPGDSRTPVPQGYKANFALTLPGQSSLQNIEIETLGENAESITFLTYPAGGQEMKIQYDDGVAYSFITASDGQLEWLVYSLRGRRLINCRIAPNPFIEAKKREGNWP